MAYQSLYLSIFLSFQQFFHHISSASMSAPSLNFVYTMRTAKCITVNKTKVLRFIFAFFFNFSFFLSLTPEKNMENMEISSKISQELLDLEF